MPGKVSVQCIQQLFNFTVEIHLSRILFLLFLGISFSCKNGSDNPAFFYFDPYAVEQGFYFTFPSDSISHPEKDDAHKAVLNAIKTAGVSIEIWCYGFNDQDLIKILREKRDAGIPVKIIGSRDQDYSGLEEEGFTILRRAKTGLQHVKVILIDRTILISGTGNFTESGFFFNNNSFFTMRISYESGGIISETLNNENIPAAPLKLPHDGRMIFSPLYGRFIQSLIVQAILNAEYRIRYLIFSHTDPVITDALYHAAKRGVLVEGIYDGSEFSESLPVNSEAAKLNRNAPPNAMIYLEGNRSRLEVSPGEFHGGHLHHKTLIIDDHRVLTGSYNWSMSARDSNLEVLYDFSNVFAASKFIDEFRRIQDTALYINPAIPEAGSQIPVLTYDADLHNFCWNGDPGHGFTVFSGTGISFRAQRFTPETSNSGCIYAGDRHLSSAGLYMSGSYLLNPDLSENNEGNFIFNLKYSSQGIRVPLPCDDGRCTVIPDLRGSIKSGWIWTDHPARFQSLRIWDGDGLHEEGQFILADKGFYKFTPPRGDAIMFLRDDSNTEYVICIRDGASLNRAMQDYIHAFNLEFGKTLLCASGE